ncbi:hypothetical protein FHS89_001437 [Rubricella aquisinus]|uniref:Phytase-like domain-containing protein n=1 Tax=Rubricella aquisinus TaxID=2028108 RepID=A0A840X0K6_9RHOB|nr:esterase-like activity of phytase family protein [Rubricella aquisinus]MBB5515425.1 hypothetical protein [Rubricella aquisinus]
MIRATIGAAILACLAGAGVADHTRMTLASQVTWALPDEWFGGFSGLLMAPDGRTFLAVTDRGTLVEGGLERDATGLITDIRLDRFGPLRPPRGDSLPRYYTDAEDIAPDPDGGFYISFEAEHRIRYYPAPFRAARPRPRHPDFASLQNNSGLEAIATDGQGRVIAIPERSGALDRPFPVYRWDGVDWSLPYRIPRRNGYLPTSADFDAAGRLYLLERQFQLLGGFTVRIRRFTLTGDEITDEETLLVSAPNALDNAEGLSLWVDDQGRQRVTLISDDNFQFLQRTLLTEYILE